MEVEKCVRLPAQRCSVGSRLIVRSPTLMVKLQSPQGPVLSLPYSYKAATTFLLLSKRQVEEIIGIQETG